MKTHVLTALVFCTILSCPVFADDATHRQTALKLLEVTNTQNMLDQIMTSIKGMMEQQFDALDLPPEGQEEAQALQNEMMTWFAEFFEWEQMRDMYVEIYTEVFSEAELKELIAFYESPLGQKMIKRMPELMQKSMQKTQAILQRKMPELQQRLEKARKELREKYKE